MFCPHCGAKKTRVRVTYDYGDQIERLRKCPACGKYFRTYEEMAPHAEKNR